MDNRGVGTKFVSVNLNKSYGQQRGQGNHHHHHNGGSHSYGITAGSRTRGGGGGMVVLSRPRSSQKAGPKLSVPPPLNLPSLRKEHEKFDVLGSVGGVGANGVSGSGMRPGSSGMGWTKPASAGGPQDKDKEVQGFSDKGLVDGGLSHAGVGQMDFRVNASTGYVPPSARSSGRMVFPDYSPVVEKATVLRGEDFPSLRAAIPVPANTPQKPKDSLSRKQEQAVGEEIGNNEQRTSIPSSALVDMRPQVHSSCNGFANGGDFRVSDQNKKRDEYFSGTLPIVRLNPRSDWADDERDTGHGWMDRVRDHGYSKNETYWDGDFDMPRASYLLHKPASNSLDRWGQRSYDTVKLSTSEIHRSDAYHHHERDGRAGSREGREGNSWRSSPLLLKGVDSQELMGDRNSLVGRSSLSSPEVKRDNKSASSVFQNGAVRDTWRKEFPNDHGQQRNHNSDTLGGQAVDRGYRDRNMGENSRYNGNILTNNSVRTSSFGSRGPPLNDPVLSIMRNNDKHNLIKSDKSYMDDTFLNDFGHGTDPLTGNLVGVVKRRKDVVKSVEVYDPVRESFEAELERVQKMQELERQRLIEGQERAVELARREEAERARQARELEEQQRRMEEEAREAELREEQERQEVLRQAEEQRIAREEEKQRILMEEERRRQAAKQKLLELEEKISRRQAGATAASNTPSGATNGRTAGLLNEKDNMEITEVGDWEDGEKMVERITNSASSDSSNRNRPFDIDPQPNFSESKRDRGSSDAWTRDPFSAVSSSNFCLSQQESGYYGSNRRDASFGNRSLPRTEFYGKSGYASSRNYSKGVLPEHHMGQPKAPRWNISSGDHLNQGAEVDSEYHENFVERQGSDMDWGQGRSGSNLYSPYQRNFPQSSEPDGSYSSGRSRYSLRQPRVLPPPTFASMHKSSYRGEIERPGPSNSQGDEIESTMNPGYNNHRREYSEQDSIEIEQDNTMEPNLNQKAAPMCDSPSSLSVSSPPDSPIHLSHDDLDDSGDYTGKSSVGDRELLVSKMRARPMPTSATPENVDASCSAYSGEEGEWSLENNELVREPEEYDEVEECYQEEDVPRDVDENNMNQSQEFDDICMENRGSPDNLVLGFDEGIEVVMPNDETERSSGAELVDYPVLLSSMTSAELHHAVGGIGSLARTENRNNDSGKSSHVVAPRMLKETEKAMGNLVIEADSRDIETSVSGSLGDSEAADSSFSAGLSSSNSLAADSSGNAILPTAPPVSAQAEMPVKLQFGLFSGPSLIPSPVPAIQIGSIKMPLHLHPQVVPSPGTMQQSQGPIFQFGQLRYPSPVSPGIIPFPSHSLSSLHSHGPVNFIYNQNQDGLSAVREGHESAQNSVRTNAGSQDVETHPPAHVRRDLSMHEDSAVKKPSAAPPRENSEDIIKVPEGGVECSQTIGTHTPSSCPGLEQGQQSEVSRNDILTSTSRKREGRAFWGSTSTDMIRKEKETQGSRANGSNSGGRVRHYVFKVKNASSRPSHLETDPSDLDSSGHQRRLRRYAKRTQFRVRENGEKGPLGVRGSVPNIEADNQPGVTARSTSTLARSGSGMALISNKLSKEVSEHDTIRLSVDPSLPSDLTGGNLMRSSKELSGKGQNQMHFQVHSFEQQSRRNSYEKDTDATMQSGVVRVFEQPGIEVPSDEDDFIEVRSKRQMLNDKREQREKEIRAKSQIIKVPRKPRSLQNVALSSGSERNSSSGSRETLKNINTDDSAKDGRGSTSAEVFAVLQKPLAAQSMPPIGTRTVKNDAQADSSSQKIKMGLHLMTSKDIQSEFMFDHSNKVVNCAKSPDSWRNSGINQQVIQLTQSQLDEAMKPGEFDPLASVGDRSIVVTQPGVSSSSVLPEDKSFSSAASPINSLLAGEKIQFGAVTSPTVLPLSRHSASQGIGRPGPLSDVQMTRKPADDDCSIFFDKEKSSSDPYPELEDCEAEAEAAASAVAVAAIGSDEIIGIGNGLSAGTISVSDTKVFRATEMDGTSTGVVHDQRSAAQLKAEEPLSVSLPADLSIDTPISLWQPLASQTTSSLVPSHFPGGPPSNYPFYEMNPILGSPILAFGPSEDSVSSQPQNSAPISGLRGSWQPAHSGLDSFYGPPAGFTGPFISPSGIHQGPPHMVVYNHFAPVGQFGQVGLSFMGTTFIPSGQQPDWKHNPAPASSPMVIDGDMKHMNVASVPRNAADMPPSARPLAPGSSLLPMDPAAMFDVPPFQGASLGIPIPPQAGVPQFSNGHSIDQSMNSGRFPKTRTSTLNASRNFPSSADATASRLPDDLVLLEPSSTSSSVSVQNMVAQSSSAFSTSSASNIDNNVSSSGTDASGFKIHPSQHNKGVFSLNSVSSSGYNNQRGGISQKGGEWTHRSGGFHVRNQPFGPDKGFSSSKVKQIYVAKQTLVAKSAS
ncbi:hypothetical protein MLD38_004601 [Melastoma candidum]|uniref:Uncharacterized protein n=1 Tax=Melastoma candidum TaxID=119954 RepID=A0ACB9S714_9MYRT|nr:hypothetical protein MLD38_004601 [Melastoma candidum]